MNESKRYGRLASRPWANALYRAVERMDFKAMERSMLEKVGFDNLKRALLPHGVVLQHGG